MKNHILIVDPCCTPEVVKVDFADDYPYFTLPEKPTFIAPFSDASILMMIGRYSNTKGKDTSYEANRALYTKKKPHRIKDVIMGRIVLIEVDDEGNWCDMSKTNRERCMELFRKPDKIRTIYSEEDVHQYQKIRFVRKDASPCEKGRTADTCLGADCAIKRGKCCILCKGGYRL